MARSFASASSQYLTRADSLGITAYPFSMACWFRGTFGTSASYRLMSISNDNEPTGGHFHSLTVNPTGSATTDDKLAADSYDMSAFSYAAHTGAVLANDTWYHGLGVWSSSTSRTVYKDGANNATNTDSRLIGTMQRSSIGALKRYIYLNSPMEGRIAEAAVWSVALSADDAASLAAGASPLTIRRDALRAFWSLRDADGDTDRINIYTMTPTNSPTYGDHVWAVRRPWVSVLGRAPDQSITTSAQTWTLSQGSASISASGGPTLSTSGQSLSLTQGSASVSMELATAAQAWTLTQGSATIAASGGPTLSTAGQSLTLSQGSAALSASGTVSVGTAAQAWTLSQGSASVVLGDGDPQRVCLLAGFNDRHNLLAGFTDRINLLADWSSC